MHGLVIGAEEAGEDVFEVLVVHTVLHLGLELLVLLAVISNQRVVLAPQFVQLKSEMINFFLHFLLNLLSPLLVLQKLVTSLRPLLLLLPSCGLSLNFRLDQAYKDPRVQIKNVVAQLSADGVTGLDLHKFSHRSFKFTEALSALEFKRFLLQNV